MSDIADSPEGPVSRPDGSPPNGAESRARAAAVRPRRSAWRWLWLPMLLVAVATALWFGYGRQRSVDPAAVENSSTPPAVAPEAEVATLRRTLDDAARVNRAMREQVLGLTQRVGLLEDGLAGVERGAAPGIDAVRMAEADFLLRFGEERLRLFADVAGAREAFALADGQLAEVSDPRATSVRQTLALERDALAGVAAADLPLILARLDRLADGVADWPLRGREPRIDAAGSAATQPGWWSRLTAALDRYFRVRRVDPNEREGAGPLLRERIALDLSRARLLLLRAQGAEALTAIESVRAAVAREFDESDAMVAAALGDLDEIRVAPLAPRWPDLGESRRELARLRGAPVAQPAPSATTPADAVPSAPVDDGNVGMQGTPPAEATPAGDVIAAPDQSAPEPEPLIDRAGEDAISPDSGEDAGPDESMADGH